MEKLDNMDINERSDNLPIFNSPIPSELKIGDLNESKKIDTSRYIHQEKKCASSLHGLLAI
jgi:hypothetical protein